MEEWNIDSMNLYFIIIGTFCMYMQEKYNAVCHLLLLKYLKYWLQIEKIVKWLSTKRRKNTTKNISGKEK